MLWHVLCVVVVKEVLCTIKLSGEKNEKKYTIGLLAALVGVGLYAGTASAMILDYGTKIQMVDGDEDTNITVNVDNYDVSDGYSFNTQSTVVLGMMLKV